MLYKETGGLTIDTNASIRDLTDAEVWRLIQMPKYRDLPPEIIKLRSEAQAEFDRRDIKLHWII